MADLYPGQFPFPIITIISTEFLHPMDMDCPPFLSIKGNFNTQQLLPHGKCIH